MSYRGVHISKPSRLSLKESSLLIENRDSGAVKIPLEDIAFIVLDTMQVNLSAALISACADQACIIIVCGKNHIPNGCLIPYAKYYRQQETVLAQLNLSLPRKKKLWQQIIKAKVINQAHCLKSHGRDIKGYDSLMLLARKVKSGDSSGIEAQAARVYFSYFCTNFKRDYKGEDRLNSLLNYGYALVRSLVARKISALGFIPSLGIFHSSMTNAFNLADDFLEPWRPFVDSFSKKIFYEDPKAEKLSLEDRQKLTEIFLYDLQLYGEEYPLLQACKKNIQEIRKYYLGGPMPEFPSFLTGR